MQIFDLINVQCLRNVLFSSEKDSDDQNCSLSEFHDPIKNFLLPLNAI